MKESRPTVYIKETSENSSGVKTDWSGWLTPVLPLCSHSYLFFLLPPSPSSPSPFLLQFSYPSISSPFTLPLAPLTDLSSFSYLLFSSLNMTNSYKILLLHTKCCFLHTIFLILFFLSSCVILYPPFLNPIKNRIFPLPNFICCSVFPPSLLFFLFSYFSS